MAKDLKRSLTLQGHRTSLSLEPEFWEALRSTADAEGLPLSRLVEKIDQTRGDRNLSSAIRVFILQKIQVS